MTTVSCPQCGFGPFSTLTISASGIDFEALQRCTYTSIASAKDTTAQARISLLEEQRKRLSDWKNTLQAAVRDVNMQLIQFRRGISELKHSLLPAVERVPFEIFQDIFQLVVDADAEAHPHSGDTTSMPWVLSYVCSRWREIALSTPSLWKHFDLPSTYNYGRPQPEERKSGIHALIQLHINRSQTTPIIFGYNCPVPSPVVDSAALAFLLNNAPRILRLNIDNSSVSGIPTSIRPIFSSLTHLRCDLYLKNNLFFDCPSLQSADLNVQGYSSHPEWFAKLKIPWSQLTHLGLEINPGGGAWTILNILSQCKSLSSLHIAFCSLEAGGKWGLENCHGVELPHVRSLHAKGVVEDGEIITGFVTRLTCPSLETLQITNLVNAGQLREFISQSGCQTSVRELVVDSVFDKGLLELLDALPQLSSLSLLQSPYLVPENRQLGKGSAPRGESGSLGLRQKIQLRIFSDLFDCLTHPFAQPGASSFLCPRLQTLTVGQWILAPPYLDPQTHSFNHFFRFLETRWVEPPLRGYVGDINKAERGSMPTLPESARTLYSVHFVDAKRSKKEVGMHRNGYIAIFQAGVKVYYPKERIPRRSER